MQWLVDMGVFEMSMLLCFGAAWPFSIYRSYVTRSTKGKSAVFLIALIIGYICGIINNWFTKRNHVLYFYILNLIMVSADLCLFFRNKSIDKANT